MKDKTAATVLVVGSLIGGLLMTLFLHSILAHAQLPDKTPPGIILTFTINKDGDIQTYEWRGIQNTIDLHNAFWMVGNYFGGEERFFKQVDDPNSYPPEDLLTN